MRTIVVQTFLTLDGVMQAPGGPDEDRDGGFEHGGWQWGRDISELLLEWESRTEALLLGRRTYDIWSGAWAVWPEDAPGLQGEFTRRYNRVPKYVASSTLEDPAWLNTHVVRDVASEVPELTTDSGEIRVWGSSKLIRSLAELDLIDEYRLITYPIILGSGKKLFPEGFPTTQLQLVESAMHPTGVTVSTYRRA